MSAQRSGLCQRRCSLDTLNTTTAGTVGHGVGMGWAWGGHGEGMDGRVGMGWAWGEGMGMVWGGHGLGMGWAWGGGWVWLEILYVRAYSYVNGYDSMFEPQSHSHLLDPLVSLSKGFASRLPCDTAQREAASRSVFQLDDRAGRSRKPTCSCGWRRGGVWRSLRGLAFWHWRRGAVPFDDGWWDALVIRRRA